LDVGGAAVGRLVRRARGAHLLVPRALVRRALGDRPGAGDRRVLARADRRVGRRARRGARRGAGPRPRLSDVTTTAPSRAWGGAVVVPGHDPSRPPPVP